MQLLGRLGVGFGGSPRGAAQSAVPTPQPFNIGAVQKAV